MTFSVLAPSASAHPERPSLFAEDVGSLFGFPQHLCVCRLASACLGSVGSRFALDHLFIIVPSNIYPMPAPLIHFLNDPLHPPVSSSSTTSEFSSNFCSFPMKILLLSICFEIRNKHFRSHFDRFLMCVAWPARLVCGIAFSLALWQTDSRFRVATGEFPEFRKDVVSARNGPLAAAALMDIVQMGGTRIN